MYQSEYITFERLGKRRASRARHIVRYHGMNRDVRRKIQATKHNTLKQDMKKKEKIGTPENRTKHPPLQK